MFFSVILLVDATPHRSVKLAGQEVEAHVGSYSLHASCHILSITLLTDRRLIWNKFNAISCNRVFVMGLKNTESTWCVLLIFLLIIV